MVALQASLTNQYHMKRNFSSAFIHVRRTIESLVIMLEDMFHGSQRVPMQSELPRVASQVADAPLPGAVHLDAWCILQIDLSDSGMAPCQESDPASVLG